MHALRIRRLHERPPARRVDCRILCLGHKSELRARRLGMVSRAVVPLMLVVTLSACSGEAGESSSGSMPRAGDSPNTKADAGSAESPPTDAGTSPDQLAEAEPGRDLITPDGWGPLRIGMSRVELVTAVGEDANPDAVGGPDPERCDEFRPSNAPAGILVMVERGVLTRISLSRNSSIRTPEGFGVGDSGSIILENYGSRARVDPHRYWAPPGKYITVWREAVSNADRRGIRYEIDTNDDVVHVRAGGPSIEYVEGCL